MSSQDAHELVAEIKELALEIETTPTRTLAEAKIRGFRGRLDRSFGGSFATLLSAAGFESYGERRSVKRVSREELFGANIEQALESHKPRVIESSGNDFKPILAIGDTHFPFAHQPTLDKIYRFAEKEQPAFIVQLGDLQDQFSHSRFPASRNYYKPDEEMEMGRKQASEFWSGLKNSCPSAQCYQITGNHDLRALKSVLQNAPSLESLVRESLVKLYEFGGVTTIHDYREELVIQDVMFHHGYMNRTGQQRDLVMQNLVSGHTHRGEVSYRALKDKTIWHLNAGFVGDSESKAMTYTPQKTTGWTLGWGWIDSYGPRFIPA